jgi:hypothetical protein
MFTRTNERLSIVGTNVKITNRQSCKRFICPIRQQDNRQDDWFSDQMQFQTDVLNPKTRFARFTGISDAGSTVAINWDFVAEVGCYRRRLFVNGKLAKVRFYQSK